MPVTEVIEDERAQTEEARLQVELERWAAKLREVRVARSGRRAALIRTFVVDVAGEEDVPAMMKSLAENIVDAAEDDASGTARRYVVALIGEALARSKSPTLAQVTIKVGDEDKAPKATDVASKLASDMGERHLKLLDVTLSTLERVAPIQALADERDRTMSAADAQVKMHVANLEAVDRREVREAKASADLQMFLLTMSQRHGAVVDGLAGALASFLRAKADQIVADVRARSSPTPKPARKRKRPSRAKAKVRS